MTYEHKFATELAARRYMHDLRLCGVRFTYWHVSVADHRVTIVA